MLHETEGLVGRSLGRELCKGWGCQLFTYQILSVHVVLFHYDLCIPLLSTWLVENGKENPWIHYAMDQHSITTYNYSMNNWIVHIGLLQPTLAFLYGYYTADWGAAQAEAPGDWSFTWCSLNFVILLVNYSFSRLTFSELTCCNQCLQEIHGWAQWINNIVVDTRRLSYHHANNTCLL